ncbi:hypothetical protein OG21DRAFT_1453917 [Imleria badia]|nr:hypothetical protein OG21DRAFT_1453917 [Imleria badia]
MSFTFQWPRFSDQFHADAIQMLNNALNKGNKPPVIADKIEVVELEMGTQPPELLIRDIGDLTMDQFRGIFRLTYAGDAHLVLKTKVQANPLNHKQPDIHLMTGSRGMLAAKEPLVVPMLLRLSHFKLNSYVVLVVSKQKGITLVFKTDPLQNVDINSTFDSIAVIQKFIQGEIEGQLRQMFREDLPGIIHRLSQQWVKAKVEAPYLDKRPPPVVRRPFDTASAPDLSHLSDGPFGPGFIAFQPPFARAPSLGALSYGRVRSVSGVSVVSSTRRTSKSAQSTPVIPPPIEPTSSFPELENFDPTYGLRPEGLPTKSVFTSFGRLFKQNKGLADLTEEQSEVDEEEEVEEEEEDKVSYSVADWEDTSIDYSPPPSLTPDDSITEYETIPAVGGGTITRPRVYHSQSMIQPPIEISRTNTDASSITTSTPSLRYPISPSQEAGPSRSRSFPYGTPRTPNRGLAYSVDTPPNPPHSVHSHDFTNKPPPLSFRRLSVSSTANLDPFHSGSPPPHHPMSDADPKIILPTLNNTLHQLSTLSYSNHTLSPYTRSLEHFAVRSGPPRTLNASGVRAPPERRPAVKAKRKRTYRIGGTAQPPPPEPNGHPPRTSAPSPVPPSEFDLSEIDRYFRSGDDPDGFIGEPGSSEEGVQQQVCVPDASLPGALPRYPHDAYETLRLRRRRPSP